MAESVSENRARMPRGTQTFLDRRTLDSDFTILSRVLKSGDKVLDVGCGSGAITRDVARRVFPGTVVGIDISAHLLQSAKTWISENAPMAFESFTGDSKHEKSFGFGRTSRSP